MDSPSSVAPRTRSTCWTAPASVTSRSVTGWSRRNDARALQKASVARRPRAAVVGAEGARAFSRQADWLVAHAVRRSDGAVIWPYTFDWREGRCRLEAPWICAMAQGLAISVLVRAYRMAGGGEHLLETCRAATRVFEK